MNYEDARRRLSPGEMQNQIDLAQRTKLGHHLDVVSDFPIPHIVCLCGSTRFKEAFEYHNREETLKGNIVLSVGTFPHTDSKTSPEELLGSEVKAKLDTLHKRKIDLADEVLVINIDGYVGSSTASEIAYAYSINKPVRWVKRTVDDASFKRLSKLMNPHLVNFLETEHDVAEHIAGGGNP